MACGFVFVLLLGVILYFVHPSHQLEEPHGIEYDDSAYRAALQYGEAYIAADGVSNVLKTIEDSEQDFREKMTTGLNEEKPAIDQAFRECVEADGVFGKWMSFKWALLIVFALSVIVANFAASASSLLSLVLLGVSILLFALFVVGGIFFTVRALLLRKAASEKGATYRNLISSSYDWQKSFIEAHYAEMHRLYWEIDDLYLASLEPMHRETVLARRDQERQHKEAMRAQAAQAAAQSEAAANTRRLLELEEEREARRLKAEKERQKWWK